MTTISKLFADGTLQTSVELDEVTYTSVKFNRDGVYASLFDEVTINGPGFPADRKTKDGKLLVSGSFDEVTIKPTPVGESIFDTPGTYTWICPDGVTSVCAVAIGGGGGGGVGGYSGVSPWSGAGGGLGWKNNITVVPGQSYTVVVGAGGTPAPAIVPPANMTPVRGGAGGNSYFWTPSTVSGYGAPNDPSSVRGGGFLGDGGGEGGRPGDASGGWGGGAGGAAGYTGNGGNGGKGAQFTRPEDFGPGFDGQGGGGGGAGGTGSGNTEIYGYSSAGGGVGLFGQGANGLGGAKGWGNPGKGGSGGEDGHGNKSTGGGQQHGGKYGGGGGASGYGFYMPASSGGGGAVRIIWGAGRSFPLNAS